MSGAGGAALLPPGGERGGGRRPAEGWAVPATSLPYAGPEGMAGICALPLQAACSRCCQ